ncbi:MAG: DNA-processing protein DprA [Clostridia bacterium]|nr:DNA-processing protein DprA [Clostridia bacterium]
MADQTLYTLWLLLTGKPGTRKTCALLRAMLPEKAYHASEEELIALLGEKDAKPFFNKDLAPAMKVLQTCKDKGIRIAAFHDAIYPEKLREIEDPPAALFYYGNLPEQRMPTLGIVGTRKCSTAAAGLAATFSCSLALSGFQIVSGMANGVDTYVHKGPLVKGYPSFAVLGCGVDVVYPKQNQTLYDILKEHGGLISEYPPGTIPFAGNFPRRNRIISGLSDGVLVVECPPKSGSMSTARFAVEQNRTLFAIPAAPNDHVNTGTGELIKKGAVFCTDPTDVMREFTPLYGDRITPTVVWLESVQKPSEQTAENPKKTSSPKPKPKQEAPAPAPKQKPSLCGDEESVYNAFHGDENLSADEISQRTGIPFHRVLPILQGLELAGHVEALPSSLFRLK